MLECNVFRGTMMIAGVATLAAGAGVYADELHLVGGDTLLGEIVECTPERTVLLHEVLGRLEIPADEIVTTADAQVAPAALHDDPAAPPVEDEPSEWDSHFEIGLGASFGNTDRQAGHVGFTSLRETERNRTALDARYHYGAANGDRDNNRLSAGIQHDWLVPESPWLYFARLRYDFDEFQSWDYRIAAHGGVGYRLIDEEDFDLTLRAGLGALKEFNSPDDDIKLEALVGFDLTWQISEKQSFEAGSTIYPDLDETGEFRTFSYAGWAIKVDDETQTALTVRFEHEHQSHNPGFEKNDYRLTAGLQFDF